MFAKSTNGRNAAMAEPLTDRQREIKELLDTGLTAREIGEHLGISRNAVYQQIQRMRKHGNLAGSYTPSGQPPRESRPGADVLRTLVPTLHESANGTIEQSAGAAAIILELRRTRDDLDAISRRLSYIVPR